MTDTRTERARRSARSKSASAAPARAGRRHRARPGRRRDQQLHDQLRPAAPGGARRPSPDPGARRRDRRARRSAHRPAPPRHREADRVQDLRPGAALLRPARLLLADVHGAQLRARHREADGPRGAAPRPVHPRADGGADPHLQPHAEPRQPHHGRGRDDAEPVAVRSARGHAAVLRARVRARGCTPIISAPAASATTCRRRCWSISATGSTTGCSCSRTRSASSPTTASSSSATSTSAWSARTTRSPGASPAR